AARAIDAVEPIVPVGTFGVRVFFVISGYLITQLLLAEQAKTGAISLKGFYLRRAFRIFPASYTYVGLILIFNAVGWVALMPWDPTCALTYTVNYPPARAWPLGHLWSLSVEEQFYLGWPALLLLLGATRAPLLAAAVLAIAPAARVV